MAPRSHLRRQANSAPAQQPLVEATIDHAASLLSDGKILSDHGDLSTRGRHNEPESPEDCQPPRLRAQRPQVSIEAYKEELLVPRTSHYDSYDPNAPLPGTLEAESHTPERYAAWGRNRFGEEWYNQRETMLQERRIYMVHDPVYEQRQKALRVLERIIEGRPQLSGAVRGKTEGKCWDRLWARISDLVPKLPPLPPPSDSSSDDDSRAGDGNRTETDLSGYDTYDELPSPRSPTPMPEDPLERLDLNRTRFRLSDEDYYYLKISLREASVDDGRKKRENEIGDKLLEKFNEETEKIRNRPGTLNTMTREYIHLMRLLHYWKESLTPEQVEASIREDDEESNRLMMAYTKLASLDGSEPRYDKEQLDERYRAWDSMGFSKELQAGLVRRLALPHLWPPSAEADSKSGELSSSRASSRQANSTPRGVRSGRVVKNTPKKQGNGRKLAACQRSVPTQAEVQPPRRGRDSPQPIKFKKPDTNTQAAIGSQSNGNTRKTYVKERASRRIAGQPTEFDMLPEPDKIKAQPIYKDPPQQPSNRRKTTRDASKKATAAQGGKPADISASRRSGRGHPGRPAK
ncbi:hypothetical protein F5X97DRAFT_344429 [Nemania serpens]|nr:hypothetical protein F5X97DRAFT_344429 [Nemania serpens]